VDLQVPVHRLLADAAGRLALGVEAIGQAGDRLLQALCDGREVLFITGDQLRVGLGGEVAGKVKRAGSQGFTSLAPVTLREPGARRFRPRPAIMRHCPGLAASPPVRYTLKVEGLDHRARAGSLPSSPPIAHIWLSQQPELTRVIW
jgi:hypothetical protein